MRERERGGYSERNSTRPRRHRHAGPATRRAAQSARGRNEPLSAAARRESGGLVSRGATAAIARARELDRPILLSIGYSACHWCHVMAHESFEDEATAGRHEPAVRQRQGRPRGAARPRQGLPARAPGADAARRRLAAHDVPRARRPDAVLRRHLLPEAAALRHAGVHGPASSASPPSIATSATACARQNAALRGVFADLEPPAADAGSRDHARADRRGAPRTSQRPSTRASAASARRRNSRTPPPSSCCCAPERPRPPNGRARWRSLTLRRMAEGGIFDQLGGGFCRYSVDPFWMIPHFEKMLYDNGPLLALLRAGGRRDGRRRPARRRARDRGLGASRDARAGGRLLRRARCGLRGPRGPLLRLAARRGRDAPRARRISRARAPLRARSRAEFRGRLAPARLRRDGRASPRNWR